MKLRYTLILVGAVLAGISAESLILDDYQKPISHGFINYVVENETITIVGYTGPRGSFVIPSSIGSTNVTAIKYRAFSGLDSLKSVTIPASITNIGFGAFNRCFFMTNISVDAENNFYSSTDGVLFSKDKTSILAYPAGRSGSYAIPDSVTFIGREAFVSRSYLTNIVIPNSVTNIGRDAFQWCEGLTAITIPASVTDTKAYRSFHRCTSLTNIAVDADNTIYSSLNGVLLNKGQTTILRYPAKKSGTYTISDNITKIGYEAFQHCSSLTSIHIPDSVTNIAGGAFSGCSSIASISIPDSVTYIGWHAFQHCSSLTSITIPDNVTSIGKEAFSSCKGLKSINMPNSITSIGYEAFEDCTSLRSIHIPNSVTSVEPRAFAYCKKLESITIPNSVTNIGYWAFKGCISLKIINARPADWFWKEYEERNAETSHSPFK